MDETPLTAVFGRKTVIKVADVLMDHPSADYSKKDLAEVTGISEATIHRHWDALERAGVVRRTRSYGNTDLYALDQDSEVVKALYQLDGALRDRLEQEQAVQTQ